MKKKYLLYDKSMNVLILYKNVDEKEFFFIPTIGGNLVKYFDENQDNINIVPNIVDDKGAALIYSKKQTYKRYKRFNNKLIPQTIIKEKEYYTKLVEFDDDLWNKICLECADTEYAPKLISIDELRNLAHREQRVIDYAVCDAALKLQMKERLEC